MTDVPHPLLLRNTPDGRSWKNILVFASGGYWLDSMHVLHGPNVVYKPIPESTTQPVIRPYSAILHTNAATKGSPSLWSYITQASVTGESHFQVGYANMEQYMPLNRRADCNYSANSWWASNERRGAISFETQDSGSATLNSTPWSAQQLAHIIGALTVVGVVYGIQCTQPATWDASGIGHHSLFPFQGPTRKAWTNVYGKTCPGKARIAQMDYIRTDVATRLAAFMRETDWKCGGAK